MSRDTYFVMQSDIQFATQRELAEGRARRTAEDAMSRERTRSGARRPSVTSPTDGWVLTMSGCLAVIVITSMFVNTFLPTPILPNANLLLGALGLGLGFHAVIGSLWVAATTAKRPQLSLTLGGLAVVAGIALPVVEATLQSSALGYDHAKPSCERNLALLQLLVERYERESGQSLKSDSESALRPVWERYRKTHAHAFFCPDSASCQGLMASGRRLAEAAFEDISYTGNQFNPDLRQHEDIDIGPPLLWETDANHPEGVHVYVANLGPRLMARDDLEREIKIYRPLQASRDRRLANR